jgi:hypothetical protein
MESKNFKSLSEGETLRRAIKIQQNCRQIAIFIGIEILTVKTFIL